MSGTDHEPQFVQELRRRHRERWSEYLESERRNVFVRAEALDREIGFDDLERPLDADEQAALDTCIRRKFAEDFASRLKSAYRHRWQRFARVLPPRAFSTALEPDETNVLKALRRWESEESTSIAVVLSPPGLGKTVGVCWWAWQFLPGQEPPRFITGAEFARSSRYGDERDDLLGASALILDDLGVESHPTDVDELVDAYYRDESRLVITSNLTREQFTDRYGERVVDRLREAGTWISLVGPSLRSKP